VIAFASLVFSPREFSSLYIAFSGSSAIMIKIGQEAGMINKAKLIIGGAGL